MVMTRNDDRTAGSGNPVIGVLALQGAFAEHIAHLRRVGAHGVEVRMPEHLEALHGLIIPGGESTTMGLIAQRWGLVEPLRAWVRSGKPTWGTCAGLILLAERAEGQKQGGQTLIGGLDVTVNRNYFGRQVDSFQTWLDAPCLGSEPVETVFIRAPAVTEVGPGVAVLATLPDEPRVIVAVQQGPILATAFHPELTSDTRWHAEFVDLVRRTNPEAVSALST
jgi:5'-phosphate synthase pdxT subunit